MCGGGSGEGGGWRGDDMMIDCSVGKKLSLHCVSV